MGFDFDLVTDRRLTNSIKWKLYPEDVLPLWVADMDFTTPEPIRETIHSAVTGGILGYEAPSKALQEVVADRLDRLYGWQVPPQAVIAVPGVLSGILAATLTVCKSGEGILIQPPVYPPFHRAHEAANLALQSADLGFRLKGNTLEYQIDWDRLKSTINSSKSHTSMFLLCHPHNPTGQVFSQEDLLHIARLCEENDTILCSDEIHAELTLDRTKHIPIASLDTSIAERTISLISPSKAFNIPGLFCSFAIIPNERLRRRYMKTVEGMAMHVNSLGLAAAEAAFSGRCDDWLEALRKYLTANRDWLVQSLQQRLPACKFTIPDATYLMWLDFRAYIDTGRVQGSPHQHFLQNAKVALNEGREFGACGEGFVRLNFGCPRSTLAEALRRMEGSLA